MGLRRRNRRTRVHAQSILCLLTLCLTALWSSASVAAATIVRKAEPEDLITLKAPDAWLYLEGRGRAVFPPGADTLLVLDEAGKSSGTVVVIDSRNDRSFTSVADIEISDTVNIAHSRRGDEAALLLLDETSNNLISLRRQGTCCFDSGSITLHDAAPLDIGDAGGLSLNPENGFLFILDLSHPRIVVLDPGPNRDYEPELALAEGRVHSIQLPTDLGMVRGLAYNPVNSRFYLHSTVAQALFEVSSDGQLVAIHRIAGAIVGRVNGFTFAPSLDRTDDPAKFNLFIASGNKVIEFSLGSEP